jgi:5'-methylthioadenosine phosphorylase
MITDYDVYQKRPVVAEEVIKTTKENLGKIEKILQATIPKILKKRRCSCKEALKNARI